MHQVCAASFGDPPSPMAPVFRTPGRIFAFFKSAAGGEGKEGGTAAAGRGRKRKRKGEGEAGTRQSPIMMPDDNPPGEEWAGDRRTLHGVGGFL